VNKDIFFSINICCYNSSKFIKESIESILKQSFKDWEIVIINDGSTDNTEKIIFDYINSGYPIKYFYQKNAGYASARNKAIDLSEGKWIVILDHDDLCEEDRLANHHKEIINNKNLKFFFGNCVYFNENEYLTNKFEMFKKQFSKNLIDLNYNKYFCSNNLVRYGCFIPSSTVVFNKEIAIKINGFNENYRFNSDYDFFFRFSLIEDIYCSNKTFCFWRSHSNQSQNKYKIKMNWELNRFYSSIYFNNKINIFTKIILFFKHILMFIKQIYYLFKN
tara:strand:+ start:1028 stop:1855 length:828 start_codon:yes stop_codon:yes gene_type:complete